MVLLPTWAFCFYFSTGILKTEGCCEGFREPFLIATLHSYVVSRYIIEFITSPLSRIIKNIE